MDEDELFNREGLSPQQYLEFTERERPPNITTEPEMTFVSSPGEPGPRGPPGVLEKINFLLLIKIQIIFFKYNAFHKEIFT